MRALRRGTAGVERARAKPRPAGLVTPHEALGIRHYRACHTRLKRDAQRLPGGGSEAYFRRVITVVRLARVLLILLLATLALSFVIGVGNSETGAVEKVALLALFVGCVALAAKVSVLAGWAQERLQRD
jgi:hypothetical protein